MKRWFALGLVALLLAGCGGSAAPQAPAGGQSSTSGSQPAAGTAAKQLTPVKLAITIQVLSFAPVFVALDGGLFQKHGLKVEEVDTDSAGGMTALESGNVQFDTTDSATLANAYSKGIKTIAVESNVNNVTLNLVVRKAIADQRHLSRNMPLLDREKALKGLKLGATTPASASDLFARYFLTQGGLVPGKDAQVISVGGGPALLAGLKQGQIDGFLLSPPTPNQAMADGYGTILISASQGDVPSLKGFAYEVVHTTPAYAAAHPDVVKAFAQAVAEANDLIRSNPDQALQILAKRFKTVPAPLLKESLADIAPAIPAGGRFSESDWAHALAVEQQTGMIKGSFDPKEGVLWTNQYLGS